MKKLILVPLILTLSFSSFSCSGGGGSGPSGVSDNQNNGPISKDEFVENGIVKPSIQVDGYFNIMKELQNGEPDFDKVREEYNSKRINLLASDVDTEFEGSQLDFFTENISKNTGLIGYDERPANRMSISEKVAVLDTTLKRILAFTVIGDSNRLVENHEQGVKDQEFHTTKFANRMLTFFYGNANKEVQHFSLAEVVQNFDKSYKQNLYQDFVFHINEIEANALDGDTYKIKYSNKYITNRIYHVFYIGTLAKLAEAEKLLSENKDASPELASAEFQFKAIRNITRSNSIADDTLVERMFDLSRDIVDYKKFVSIVNKGIARTASAERKKALESLGSNQETANLAAVSAGLYLDMLSAAYKNVKYSKSETEKLVGLSKDFRNAVESGNKAEAEAVHEKINALYNL